MRSGTKRKRRTEVATAEPIDPDQWIRDARGANDHEAVAWFARIRATNTAQDEPTPKRQCLSVHAQRWEQYKTTANTLAQEHAQQTHDIYHRAHAAALALQHLRTLHTHYTNTLTAKTDYHMLVTKLIKDQMPAQRLHDTHTHTHLCQIRRQWYEQAKHDTGMWYPDTKMLLLICGRYKRLCAGTEKLLDLHLRQALDMWCQKKHLANMTQCYHDACKHKTTQYWQTSRPAR